MSTGLLPDFRSLCRIRGHRPHRGSHTRRLGPPECIYHLDDQRRADYGNGRLHRQLLQPTPTTRSLEYFTPDEFEAVRSDHNPARTLITVGQ
jgi:hypothetical protein